MIYHEKHLILGFLVSIAFYYLGQKLMKLIFPLHFQTRILERAINLDHVKSAITKPDFTENMFDGRIRVTKNIGEKCIRVVYYKNQFGDNKKEYIIITAYYIQT